MGTLHLEVNVRFHFRASTVDWLPARLIFYIISTFWTLAPCDHITYCETRRVSVHTSTCGECVCFNLKDSMPPEVAEDYLAFLWSDSKWAHLVHCEEIFYFELELLTSFYKALLG